MRKRLAKKIVKGRYIYCDYEGRIPYWLDKWDERWLAIHFKRGYDRRLDEAERGMDKFVYGWENPGFCTKPTTKYKIKHRLWKLRNKKQTF